MKLNKKNIIILIITALLIITFAFIEKCYIGEYFSFDRLIIVSCVLIFIDLHFIFDIKKMYEFIYKKRYIIGGLLLLFIVIRGYHGSSIDIFNRFIQPNNIPKNGFPILGMDRGIRSDEWMVGTPTLLSQAKVGFTEINNLMMAKDTAVSLYPSYPCLSIALLGKLFFVPFMFLPLENAFSLMWFGKLFVLFFASFELFMIITKKNKLYSLLGSILITFSATNMWWYSVDMMMWGNLAVLILYYFIKSKKIWQKLGLALAMGLVGTNYILLMYPAWQIPFGFVYLILFIWILVKNKKDLHWKFLLYIPIVFGVIATIIIPTLLNSSKILDIVNNTVYPGQRLSLGGNNWEFLFIYIFTPFYSFINVINPSEYSNYFGFYPIPFFMAIFYMIKNKIINKKLDLYVTLFIILILFLSLWCYVALPSWFVKISLLSFSSPGRSQIVVGYACIFLFIYLMSNYEKKEKIIKKDLLIAIGISLITFISAILIVKRIYTLDNYKILVCLSACIFLPFMTLLILNNKKTNYYFAIFLSIIIFGAGIVVNPVSKGFSVIYDKPVSKEIQKITKEEPNAIWATMDCSLYFNNYILANGAKTLNSTNFVPNLKLWKMFDLNDEYSNVYNRYAHVSINIVDEPTSFVLNGADHMTVKMNTDDICKINIKYVVSTSNLTKYNKDNIKFENIYEEDGVNINKIICN